MKNLVNEPQAPGAVPDEAPCVRRDDGDAIDPAGLIDLDDGILTAVTGGVIFIDIDTDTYDRHDCQCTPC